MDGLRVVLDHLLTVAGFVLALTLVLRVLGERRQPGGTMAWLLAIVLIPYVGVPLYLSLGGRKLARQASRKTPLYATNRGELHLVEETFFQGGRRLVQAG
ncbi:MAG: PLDc N-terminal domain-containing protein, partial [Candidatus Hydrogenedentes bacterium]|nr:PLDc N-terminal domain-containing protein [Candidatus Hydrogenedentota bacterium]